jgi:hypothetical protein
MPLAAAAFQPFIVPQLIGIGTGGETMTLSDLVMVKSAGYALTVTIGQKKRLALDFRESNTISAALASDCGRFSCAAFQSVSNISNELENRDSFAWSFVKLYYAAFYAGHALIRVLGEGCSYFYKPHTDRLATVADAQGIDPPLRIDSGLYHCVLGPGASVATFARAAAVSGGTHEAFWFIFGSKMKAISESILLGPLPRSDGQAIFAQVDQMINIISRKTGYSWLSVVRNDLQYRLQHGAWYPERVRSQIRSNLARAAGQWTRDPMSIDMANQRLGLRGDFVLTCSFIVSLCREIFGHIADRSSEGRRSFARTGPLAFLNDIGVAID